MNDRLVIIPTYNEKENIENIIRCVFSLKPAFDILIIEDNSPDGTAGIVKTLQKEFTNLHIIERKGKLGLGTAYITGFKWALEHRYDYIFEMDADFSHNPRDLVRLYEAWVQGRPVDRFALCDGSQCGQLADEPGVIVLFCFKICKNHYRNEST